MLYTINRNYSITGLSFAPRVITKRSLGSTTIIRYGRRDVDGARENGSLKSVSHVFANPLCNTAYYRVIIFTVIGRGVYTKNIVRISINYRGDFDGEGRRVGGREVIRVWFFLIYSAKKTRDLFVPRRFRIPPRLWPCTVRQLTFRKHGSYARNNHFVVDTRHSVDFREKKIKAASIAFMKT